MTRPCYRKTVALAIAFYFVALLVSCRSGPPPFQAEIARSGGTIHAVPGLLSGEEGVVCLIFFGGGHGKEDRLWCEDSQEEIPLWAKLVASYRGQPVSFLGVSCPPVYGDGGYGDGRARFFDAEEGGAEYREACALFEKRTAAAELPFPVVFDFRFRNLLNRTKPLPKAREIAPWEGRWKSPEDGQSYGTPTIWLLATDGRALGGPFFGNNYPDKIRYRFEDVAKAIDEALTRLK